ncbi:MAG: hypothetical protein P1V51_16950 [Deltaproteobacteria bacterium]|nr:hypothetical protein [Deltaproteobacteria bacterium]
MSLSTRLVAGVVRRVSLAWAVALAVVLSLPALGGGRVLDDFLHLAMQAEDAPPDLARSPLDLYRIPPAAEHRQVACDAGRLPWHATHGFDARLMRPLSSLTLALDHALWRDSPAIAHAHSLLWYAALVLLAGLLYRKVMPTPELAALAALLYAIDDTHGFTVGWIANRQALVSLVFALLALLAHLRWRREGWRPGAWLAPLALALGLLAGETALAITAYLFSYALFLERGRWTRRLATLAPAALVCVLWRVAYDLLGYGAGRSGYYVDPVRDPLRYLASAAERLPRLLQGLLTPVQSDFFAYVPPQALPILTLIVGGGVLLFVAILWRLLKTDRLAAFWATATVLSLLPACAAQASDRNLIAATLGGMGLIAQLIARHPAPGLEAFWARRRSRLLIGSLVLFHLVLSPLAKPFRTYQPHEIQAPITSAFRSLDRVGELRGRTLVILHGLDFFWTTHAGMVREGLGLSPPERIITLSTGMSALVVSRVDERTLRLTTEGAFFDSGYETVMLDPDRPFRAGEPFSIEGVRLVMEAVDERGLPTAVRATFDDALEQADRVWVVWSADGYVPFELPAVGEEVEVPAIDALAALTYTYAP